MIRLIYNRIFSIFSPPFKKLIAARLVYKKALNFPIWGEGSVAENVDNAINLLKAKCTLTKNSEYFIRTDMVYSYLVYGSTPLEYLLFDFISKKHSQRKSFLTDKEKDILSINNTGMDKFKTDLQDKYHFYQLLSEYFKRGVMKLDKNTTWNQFEEFCKQEQKCFIKPLNASYGVGAMKYSYSVETCRELFDNLSLQLEGNSFIIEGLIEQDCKLSAFNESSVNTVRLPTILNKDGFHVIGPFLRTGRKGSIVDNGGGGGIFSAIDEKEGVIISNGCDEKGNHYENHPDSQKKFVDFQIPEWHELLQIAEKAHSKMKGHKYIAWDFAYTPNGWVLIEGNWGQFLSQFATGKGLRKRFEKLMNN